MGYPLPCTSDSWRGVSVLSHHVALEDGDDSTYCAVLGNWPRAMIRKSKGMA